LGSRAVTASLAAAVVVTGCGGSGNDRRDGVQRFLQQANAAEAASGPSFNAANRAYIAFSKGKLATPTAERDLARSEQAMRETRDRISAIAAPTDALELKRRLVVLLDADAALAHETTLLAAFVPAAQAASKTLPTVGNRLTRGLRDAKGPAGQERALRTYAAALSRVIRRLVPLHPPPLLLDRHETHAAARRRAQGAGQPQGGETPPPLPPAEQRPGGVR
jgi:hypothetical protein